MFSSFGIINYWTYCVAVIAVVLLPGPNSLFVLATASKEGVVKGYQAACAVFVGDATLMLLSALGVASLLKTLPLLFAVVKTLGAAYLFYLGFMMLRKSWQRRKNKDMLNVPPIDIPKTNPFYKALLLSLSNPKSILFFVAFFIQFVDPQYAHTGLSFLILGLTVEMLSAIYLTFLIFSGVSLAMWFRKRQRLSSMATTGVGLLFMGFGVKLAIATLD